MKRRKSRENAFIVVFESFFLNLKLDILIDMVHDVQDIRLDDYSKKLIFGVLKYRKEIDDKITSFLKNWEFSRISRILISILEISFYEILYSKDIDFPVSINEAVELAKKYFGGEGPSFINGVLGNFVKNI